MNKHNDKTHNSQEITRVLMMNDPERALDLINENKATDYYRDDFQFKITTEIQHMKCDNFLQNFDAVLERGSAILKEISGADQPRLFAECCSVLGAAFLELYMLDEVVRCYNDVIAIEEENGRTNLTSVAYNNLGAMYFFIEEYEKAVEMFEKAYHNRLIDGEEGRATTIELNVMSNLVLGYSHLKAFEKAEKTLEKLQVLQQTVNDVPSKRVIDYAYTMYYLNKANYDKARQCYNKLLSLKENRHNPYFVCRLTNYYCKICRQNNIPYDKYIDIALKLGEVDFINGNLDEMIKLCMTLTDYYEDIGNTSAALSCYRKMKKYTERSLAFSNSLRHRAVTIRQDLEKTREESISFNQKNKELSMIAQEALSMRNKLQEAYNQINMISMLGSKLTTATTFSDLKNIAFKIICDKMDVTSFTILAVSDDKQYLVSMAEKSEPDSNIKISLRDVSSLFVESCLQNRIIVCSDVNEEVRRKDAIIFDESCIESIVFIPLSYENQVIGVLTVQSIHKNAYSNDKVEFLKLISSYLSIALNNVKKSRALMEEINLHKQTQLELEKVNLYLKNLSSLDGLTKVNNRRAFDEEYSELISRAERQNKPIAVIMIDIDYFKKYNDRYGHLKGDEALIKVAQKINQAFLNEKSTFARFGGEEFIAVTVGYKDKAIANLCEQIRLSIANMLIENEDTDSGYLTVSIGAAQMSEVSSDVKSKLMRQADEMLYKAKDDGRNRCEVSFLN